MKIKSNQYSKFVMQYTNYVTATPLFLYAATYKPVSIESPGHRDEALDIISGVGLLVK